MKLKLTLLFIALIGIVLIYACASPYVFFYSVILFRAFSESVLTFKELIQYNILGFLLILGYSGSFLLIVGFVFHIGSNPNRKPTVIRAFKWLLFVDLILCLILFGTRLADNINYLMEANAPKKHIWDGKEIHLGKELDNLPSNYRLNVKLSHELSNDEKGVLYIEKTHGKIKKADIVTILEATKGLNQVLEVRLHKNESDVDYIINKENEVVSCTIFYQGDKKDMDPSVCAAD